MLATRSIIGFIPTRDAARARTFYEQTLGLRFLSQDDFAVVFDANGTMLRVTIVGDFTPAPFTIFGWQVTDINQEVAELTARGVSFNLYTFLEQMKPASGTPPEEPESHGSPTPTATPSPSHNTKPA